MPISAVTKPATGHSGFMAPPQNRAVGAKKCHRRLLKAKPFGHELRRAAYGGDQQNLDPA